MTNVLHTRTHAHTSHETNTLTIIITAIQEDMMHDFLVVKQRLRSNHVVVAILWKVKDHTVVSCRFLRYCCWWESNGHILYT